MLKSIRDLLRRHRPVEPESEDPSVEVSLAIAALLVEILRADYAVSADERRQVLESLRGQLSLSDAACKRLLEDAERQIDRSHDLYQFTSRINRSCTDGEKQQLIEQLWRVARADSVVHKYEEHLIRRIADLLYVPHSAYITAKLRSERPENGADTDPVTDST